MLIHRIYVLVQKTSKIQRFNTILTKIFLPFNVFSKMKSEKLDVFFSISGGQVWIPGGQRIKGKKGTS